jgi:hypothetical protein
MRLALLLLVAPLAAAHMQCGDVAPGKGLLHVQAGDTDRMCGFVMAQQDGPIRFETNVPGARVYIAKQLVSGPVSLKAGDLYAIHIEAPAREDFVLSWDGSAIATELLFKPTATVGAPCSSV